MLHRLLTLEENIATLKEMSNKITIEDIKKSKFDEWALRYGIFESIQIVIDIACHISSKYNLGVSKNYAECIEKLEKFNYISSSLAKSLISAIGLRNMLIHEYVHIDIEKLYSFLDYINDFGAFALSIKDSIK